MKELKIIDQVRKRAGAAKKPLKTGIGDDCAVLDFTKGEYLLWASDMVAEGTHFKKKDGYKRIGRKAVSVNISDIAAMGGEAKYITVSLGLPRGTTEKEVESIYEGIFEVCKKHGVKVAGGDTIRASKLVLDVSIIGTVSKKKLVLRSGAKKGDLILVTGPVRNGKKEHLDFTPRVKESKFLTENYKVNSMIDTSDGIALDAHRLSQESRVGCRIYENAIPLSAGLSLKDAFYYGESFELLFTMTRSEAEKLFHDKRLKKKCPYFIIGDITDKKEGMSIIASGGRIEKLKAKGYSHI